MKKTLLCTAALAALAAPQIASANIAVRCATDTTIAVDLTGWASPAALQNFSVGIDNVPLRTGPFTFTGHDTTLTFPIAAGTHAVAAAANLPGKRVYTDAKALRCAPTPAPEPPGGETTPPPPPPPVVVIIKERPTCTALRASGAGQKWLKKFGCVSKPLTCEALKGRKAGRGWYAKLGVRYYECHIPVPRRVTPPVAG